MNDKNHPLKNFTLNNDWQFRQARDANWYLATVPGCIHLDLLDNQLIEDPFYRDNETKVQWIENEDWEYRLIFNVPQEILIKKHIDIIFEGLDTYATVTLNGQQIIEADNMFRPWQANVKFLLRQHQNELIVYFRSPIQEILPQIKHVQRKLPAMSDRLIGTSPYTRKAPYHYGWDWGPRLVTSGIWQPVKLEVFDNLKITEQQFIIKQLDEKKALLEMILDLFSEVDARVNLKIKDDRDKISIDQNIQVHRGPNQIKKEIKIHDPELWWPNGYGMQFESMTQLPIDTITQVSDKQPLYTFHTEISTENDSATISKRIGLRTIEVKREADQWGESFTIVVNGVPIFIKGANWIPADSFTPRISKEKYHYLLYSATQSHINIIRVWGGGIYEAEMFYDLCDEYGILIWQDFMFSCALYPGDEQFLNSVREEAAYQIRRLRHHPSIALWCGNNEIEMGWHDWHWQENLPASMWEDYLKLFHGVLPEVCNQEDTTRFYLPSSPASDQQAIINPQDAAYGDTHYWGVWHGQEPFDNYKKHLPRFISEFGFQSFPAPQSVAKFTDKTDHDIFSPVMLIHQKNDRGNQIIKGYLEKYFIVPQKFDHFLLLSQVLQAEGIKTGAEHFRQIRPRCMGCLYWQLNDCWPVASWSSIDYYGQWKALHYYARRFYAPVLISPNFEDGAFKFYIISDIDQPLEAKLQIKLMSFSGQIFSEFEKHILIHPNLSRVYHLVAKSDITENIDPNQAFLYCAVNHHRNIVTENALFFGLQKKMKLTSPEIKSAIRKIDSGFLITLSSKNLAKTVILTVNQIEGFFEDNFFDLFPGIEREIKFTTQTVIDGTDFQQALSFITLYELMEL